VRRALAAIAIVLACVLPAAAVASWWAYAQATDTTRFMETARPLATDDTVQRQVVDELVAVSSTRLDQLGVPLPGGQAAVRRQIRATAESLVQTPAFRRTWLAILRTTHARLAARVAGDVRAPLTLDLAPVADVLRARVRSAGLAPVADAIVDPAPVVLLDRGEVRRARDAVDRIRIVRGIAIPGAVLALLGVLLTAGGLARGLVRSGLCVGVATLLLVGTDALARGAISSSGTAGELRLAVYDVLTEPVHGWVIGGVIAAVALVAAGVAASAFSGPRRAPAAPARPARGA
jgi:hypothetical protein